MSERPQNNEPLHDRARLRSLAETGLLETPGAESLDRYARITARALRAPVSLVSLVSESRQVFAGAHGLQPPWRHRRETPLSHSFCQHVVMQRSPLVVDDARNDPRVCDNLAIRDLNVAAYAGVPLCDPEGKVLGSLCVIDDRPREWTPEELELLHLIADEVAEEIELTRRAELAEKAEQALAEVNEEIAAAHRRAAEHNSAVMHDLRTPLQVVSAAARSLSEHPSVRSSETLARTVDMLQRNVRQIVDLVKPGGNQSAEGDLYQRIDVAELVGRVCADLQTAEPVAVDYALEPAEAFADATMVQRAVQNLFSNALRFAAGRIRVSVSCEKGQVRMVVEDDGEGLPSEEDYDQVWELGRRFHADRSNTGMGLAVTRQLIQTLSGVVKAGPSSLGGARFELILPEARGRD
jgi:signal transduction histidine kinase